MHFVSISAGYLRRQNFSRKISRKLTGQSLFLLLKELKNKRKIVRFLFVFCLCLCLCFVLFEYFYCETYKTVNTNNISGMWFYCKERANQVCGKLNSNQQHWVVCVFVASSHVLISSVICHNTINIPTVFQVLTVLLVWQWDVVK